MLFGFELRREDFAHDAIGVDNVGDSSRQKAEGLGDAKLLAVPLDKILPIYKHWKRPEDFFSHGNCLPPGDKFPDTHTIEFGSLVEVAEDGIFCKSGFCEFLIPERIITRAPSAELRHDQKDQDSLPPYEILDAIMEAYVEHDQSPGNIVAMGYTREDVVRVTRLIDRNEYKRRQSPIGVRITQRGFGKDRRYPITSKFVLNG
ncbi:MAG: hypothetical protein EBU34_12015 [Alphaproteobacteria bacterium]|nr:hypothetical protein [Alphaproteobacteria bacterium]